MSVLSAEDRDRAREALRHLGVRSQLSGEDGALVDLPEPVVDALAEILEVAASGQQPLVVRSPDDLSTQQAATVLGVSRPTVVRLIDAGKLSARMVGTHRRLALDEVLAYRDLSVARRRDALEEMTREAEVAGLYG